MFESLKKMNDIYNVYHSRIDKSNHKNNIMFSPEISKYFNSIDDNISIFRKIITIRIGSKIISNSCLSIDYILFQLDALFEPEIVVELYQFIYNNCFFLKEKTIEEIKEVKEESKVP